MAYEEILYTLQDRVATVTLNRPDKLNAWTKRMEDEVAHAIRTAATDDDVRVIVLTGAGRGFCAGADMSLLQSIAGEGGTSSRNVEQHIWMLGVSKPIIAAVNGPAVGLGFVIAMYCDLRFASEAARFSTVFSKRGLVAEYGMAWMLPRLIGLGNAVDLLFSSRVINAAEAHRMGFVNQVLPHEDFLGAVQRQAAEMAATVSPRSLGIIKKQIYAAQAQNLEQSVDMAIEEMWASFSTEDFREGVAHFIEKRAPVFTGK